MEYCHNNIRNKAAVTIVFCLTFVMIEAAKDDLILMSIYSIFILIGWHVRRTI